MGSFHPEQLLEPFWPYVVYINLLLDFGCWYLTLELTEFEHNIVDSVLMAKMTGLVWIQYVDTQK